MRKDDRPRAATDPFRPLGALHIEDLPSPNHDPRPEDARVDTLVLHAAGRALVSAAGERRRLSAGAAASRLLFSLSSYFHRPALNLLT